MKNPKKLFLHTLPGSWTEYGQVECPNEKEVRKKIRRVFGLKSTRGCDIRETTKEKEELNQKEKETFYAETLKANSHLSLTDF